MPKGILLVQSSPASSEETDTFHHWYDDIHIPEMLAVDGVASARRLEAGGSYLVIYEVDDVEKAQAAVAQAQGAGRMTAPVGVQLDPPPSVQWFSELS